MFANGGMVAPAASGILASSQPLMQAAGQQGPFPQPLMQPMGQQGPFPQPMGQQGQFSQPMGQQGQSFVDSMTQDAVNPMGGGTLAMEEGGVARSTSEQLMALNFQNGGIQLGAPPRDLDVTVQTLPSAKDFTAEAGQMPGILDINDVEVYSSLRAFGLNENDAMKGVGLASNFMTNNPNAGISEAINFALKPGVAPAPVDLEAGYREAERDAKMVLDQPGAEDQIFVDQQKKIIADAQEKSPEAYETAVRALLRDENYSQEFKDSVLGTFGAQLAAGKDGSDLGGIHPFLRNVVGKEVSRKDVSKEYTTQLGALTSYLKNNPDANADDVPSSVLSDSMDGIFDAAITKAKEDKFDKNAFKDEIELLIPAVKDDPETEGLLIAMLGAAIMAGKDKNWVVNLGEGAMKALPALINFKNKKKEAERTRAMTVAKLTIEQGLSRDKEIRTAVSALENQRTATGIKEAQRRLKTKDWWISESITIPAELIGGKKGDPDTFLPQGSTLSLNELEHNKLTNLGVQALPFERGSWKPSDILDMRDTVANAKHVKALNAYGTEKQAEVFKAFRKEGGIKINYYIPTVGSILAGSRTENMINPSDLNSFMAEYYAVKQPTIDLRNDVRDILEMVLDDPTKFKGFGLLLDQTRDFVIGLAGKNSASAKFLDSLGATPLLGAREQARTKALIVLAKIAPLLLDESGKTISDADRLMIANTLGLKINYKDEADKSKGFSVDLNMGIFTNPEKIVLAISQTEQALNRRLNYVNDTARVHLRQFGVSSSAREMLDIERQQKERLASGFRRFTKGEGQLGDLDFNLT